MNPHPKPLGRRSKCTEPYISTFCEHVAAGKPLRAAAALAGIHVDAVMNWLSLYRDGDQRFTEFAERYARARGQGEARAVERIRALGDNDGTGRGDWRAQAWLAERMYPEDLNLKQLIELGGQLKVGPIDIVLERGPEKAIDLECLENVHKGEHSEGQ
jgi:hypothetical protein